MMRTARLLLLPVAVIYWLATAVRNWLYDIGALRSRAFGKPVICVGNITVGGTGKTPVIEHLARLLSHNGLRVAVVSRGYRRKSRGQVVAMTGATAEAIGDEPCQIKRHIPEVDVIVDADRAAAIDTAIARGADAVLMDDGMQHRSVRPGALIMVCDYARPLWRDLPLPAGDKREPATGRLRADVVIVNKCPRDLTKTEAEAIFRHLSLNDGQKIFFSAIAYSDFTTADGAVADEAEISERGAVAIAGIGRPGPFFTEVERRTGLTVRMAFADHHAFTASDIAQMGRRLDEAGPDSYAICTEKDATKLPARVGRHEVLTLPIRTEILLGEQTRFDNLMLSLAAGGRQGEKTTQPTKE